MSRDGFLMLAGILLLCGTPIGYAGLCLLLAGLSGAGRGEAPGARRGGL